MLNVLLFGTAAADASYRAKLGLRLGLRLGLVTERMIKQMTRMANKPLESIVRFVWLVGKIAGLDSERVRAVKA